MAANTSIGVVGAKHEHRSSLDDRDGDAEGRKNRLIALLESFPKNGYYALSGVNLAD